ncbi:putative protein phosphatase 2C 33 [Tasmannia lanceolata]|uniref:putative protein phosphatase 2C 33 n=1 Tax=Tasmannia lanceolata TaxID=3420 RepID=UPI0040630431
MGLGFRNQRKKVKRENGMRNSSVDSMVEEDEVHKVPGRMFRNGSSNVASMCTRQGNKGTNNQDAMIVSENFGLRVDTVFCGVFDGHGPYGHMVSRRVRDSLPLKLSDHWEVNRASDSFLKAFKVMDNDLRVHPNIDCYNSGTTAVTLVKQGQDLIIGNVGDSRAILGTRDDDGTLTAVQLTVDLKPNLPRELQRIWQCGGRVVAKRKVARVYLPYSDFPGLAMARAFGDFCLKDFGVISDPDIYYRRLTKKDEFIVLASDGIWDVLSNKEVVDIVASAPSRSSAAQSLVESAVLAWRFKYPRKKSDDCSVVCLFLDSNPYNSRASNTKTKRTGHIGRCGPKIRK